MRCTSCLFILPNITGWTRHCPILTRMAVTPTYSICLSTHFTTNMLKGIICSFCTLVKSSFLIIPNYGVFLWKFNKCNLDKNYFQSSSKLSCSFQHHSFVPYRYVTRAECWEQSVSLSLPWEGSGGCLIVVGKWCSCGHYIWNAAMYFFSFGKSCKLRVYSTHQFCMRCVELFFIFAVDEWSLF